MLLYLCTCACIHSISYICVFAIIHSCERLGLRLPLSCVYKTRVILWRLAWPGLINQKDFRRLQSLLPASRTFNMTSGILRFCCCCWSGQILQILAFWGVGDFQLCRHALVQVRNETGYAAHCVVMLSGHVMLVGNPFHGKLSEHNLTLSTSCMHILSISIAQQLTIE